MVILVNDPPYLVTLLIWGGAGRQPVTRGEWRGGAAQAQRVCRFHHAAGSGRGKRVPVIRANGFLSRCRRAIGGCSGRVEQDCPWREWNVYVCR
jgi:hypothetical protein